MADFLNCKEDNPQAIKNLDKLLRRVHKKDAPRGKISPSAFDDPYCSVDIEEKLTISPIEFLGVAYSKNIQFEKKENNGKYLLKRGWKVAAITPKEPRMFGQSVYPEPCEVSFKDQDFINEAHAKICGKKLDDLLFKMAEEANKNIIL